MDETMTDQIRHDLQKFEGYRDHVYQDTTHHPTIGYGTNLAEPHNQQLLEQLGYDVPSVLSGAQAITKEDAISLLNADIAIATADASAFVPSFSDLDPHAQIALIELDYNVGHGGLYGNSEHYGYPALQEALSHMDYARAENEIHTKGISEERNDHLYNLLDQAAHASALTDASAWSTPSLSESAASSSPNVWDSYSAPASINPPWDNHFVHDSPVSHDSPATSSSSHEHTHDHSGAGMHDSSSF